MRRVAGPVLALALVAAPALAQPPQADADAPVLGALTVAARQPGPAWWKVSQGDATVYIFGLPMGPAAKGTPWDRTALRRRLALARLVVLPPSFTAGLFDIPAFLRARKAMRTKVPLKDQLPAPLYARYLAALPRAGKAADRYEGWDAVVAGQILRIDFLKRAGLDDRDGAKSALDSAPAGLKRKALAYRAAPELAGALSQVSPANRLACFEGALEDIEAGADRYARAEAAWARGDVAGAVDLPNGSELCRDRLAGRFMRRSGADIVAAIGEALNSPGVTVALVPLRRLVVQGGVVETLRARGYAVTDPAGLSDP